MDGRPRSHILALALALTPCWACVGVTEDDDDDVTAAGDDDTTAATELSVCGDGSGDRLTIQEAIDAAEPGATLVVCAGTFAEDLVIEGKPLTIRGEEGPENTEVLGSGEGSVWRILGVDEPGVVIEGLTVVGGLSEDGGGGIHCEDAVLELRAIRLTGSQGAQGGGLMASECRLTLTDSELDGNTADYFGGGAYLIDSEAEVSGCLIHDNDAPSGGGIGIESGDVVVRGCEIRGNEATASSTTEGGGGIYAYGDAEFFDNVIADNTTDGSAGGLFALGNGEIRGNTITGNFCESDGGGVYAYASSSWIHDNEITFNEAGDDAGALRVRMGDALIENNVLSFNRAATGDGGAAKLSHTGNVFVDNVVEGNVAGDEGGGVELDNDNTWISGCLFADNEADEGGGVHTADSYEETCIEDSTFTGNTASAFGGGIHVEAADELLVLLRLRIEGNQAAHGGGIHVEYSQVSISNTILAGNSATTEGGGLALDDSGGWITNTTVTGNAAPSAAGIALGDLDELRVANTIVAANQDGAGVSVSGDAPAAWQYNDVYGHAAGDFSGMTDPTGTDGNLSTDPEFVDPDAGDYHLSPTSACVDSGLPDLLDPDGSRSDIGTYGGPYGGW